MTSNDTETPQTTKTKKKARMGRPPKELVESKKPGNRGVVGRPPGDAAIMNEYRARMLSSPKSKAILDKILNAALDDEHKHQAVAWKLVAERVLPISLFDPKRAKAQGGVQVTITAADGSTVTVGQNNDDAIDGVYDPVDIEGEVDESDPG